MRQYRSSGSDEGVMGNHDSYSDFPPRGRCSLADPFSGRPGAAATHSNSNFNIGWDTARRRPDRAISFSIGDTSGKTQLSAASPPALKGE